MGQRLQRAAAHAVGAFSASRQSVVLCNFLHREQPGLPLCGAASAGHAASGGRLYHQNTPHLCPLSWRGMCPAVSVPHLCPLSPGVVCVQLSLSLIFVLSPGVKCVQLSLSLIFVLTLLV